MCSYINNGLRNLWLLPTKDRLFLLEPKEREEWKVSGSVHPFLFSLKVLVSFQEKDLGPEYFSSPPGAAASVEQNF